MPVRFRFCGDDIVPDWVLTAINDLSYLDTTKLKALIQMVVKTILSPDYTIENNKKLTLPEEYEDDKMYIAAIVFILQSATSYDVGESTLSNELQQVGLPHEHAIVLCKIYTENASELKLKSKQLSLRCSIPKKMNCVKEGIDRILKMNVWQAESSSVEEYSISLSEEQVRLLIHELNSVHDRIETLL